MAHQLLGRHLESAVARHFAKNYYSLLLLPNCHPGFYNGWISDIQDLMNKSKSLQYSVLACAAAHLHFIDGSGPMQELSLAFYSNAIKGLADTLASGSEIAHDNGLLTSIIMLYLHGVSLNSLIPFFLL